MRNLSLIAIIISFIISGKTLAQDSLLVIPSAQAKSFARSLHSLPQLKKQKKTNDAELIVGYPDPNETLTITGSYHLDGDLAIVNNGILLLDNADFYIDGDIYIMGNGTLDVRGGNFTIVQEYIYEHESLIIENGRFLMNGVNFTSSNQSWDIGMTNEAYLEIHDSHISKGFITTAMMENSSADIARSILPGEYLCFNQNTINFSQCDSLLFWFVLPENSKVDMTLPADSMVVGFEFSEETPGVTGIDYAVSVDSCTNVWWGTIAISGCDVIFRDTKLRAAGLYVDIPDSVTISNLTNGYKYSDKVLDVPDRNMRMINTEVETWNFYASKEAKLTIENCVFGEILSMDSSHVVVDNSVCDGSGGYIGAFARSEMILYRTLNMSQTIARETGILVAAMSSLLGTEIDADESAAIALLNTGYLAVPEAHGGALLFEEKIGWVDNKINEQVPVVGSARILSGPDNPLEFKQYKIEYAAGIRDSSTIWRDTDGMHKQPVENGLLALWNTQGLTPGFYGLRLTLYPTMGDSLTLETDAQLVENTTTYTAVDLNTHTPNQYRLYQNYPNPFNPVTRISFELQEHGFVELGVYNVKGEKLATLIDEDRPAGHYEVMWNGTDASGNQAASGVYYYTIRSKEFSDTRKMVLIR